VRWDRGLSQETLRKGSFYEKEVMIVAKKGLLIIMASIAPEKEEAYNRWYNEDHLPKLLERFPGILSGRRYKIVEGEEEHRFMALYEFESYEALEAAMKSEQMKQLVREYDEAFGKGGRRRMRAIELKSLTVG
jgi:antibiotic biosynthesis monooxygenase (ABM) superfamily enzyme